MRKVNTYLLWVACTSLIALLILELVLSYDTTVRQIALAVTNIAAIIALLLLRWRLRKHSTDMPWIVAWSVALGVWFDAAGNFAGLYATYVWWDKLAHGVGAAAVALAVFVLMWAWQQQKKIRLTRWLTSLFATSLAILLTVVYEISEYIGDLLFETVRVTDLYDVADDLLWNLLAIIVVVWIADLFYKKKARD